MPHYRASRHAIQRLIERLPDLAVSLDRAQDWLAAQAARADVVLQQAGMDLLLGVEVGLRRIWLPITPSRGDTWTIRTVLTDEQARANCAVGLYRQHAAARMAWRQRKGFARQRT